MTSFYPYNYDGALECLQGARNQYSGRPLGSSTRLVHCTVGEVECVGVKYHNTVVVAYLPNGNVVLNSGGWRTITTAKRFRDYAPQARVYSGYKLNVRGEKASPYTTWLVQSSPMAMTPPKVQKCRMRDCKGNGKYSYTTKGKHVYVPGENGAYGRHVWEEFETPKVTWHECYRCKGTGQVDYGSKAVCPTFEDGVIIDPRGFVVGYGPAPRHTGLSATTAPSRAAWRPANFAAAFNYSRPSSDADTVRFNEISDAAHAEMLQWMGILKKESK
jgi:hypothetical protein